MGEARKDHFTQKIEKRLISKLEEGEQVIGALKLKRVSLGSESSTIKPAILTAIRYLSGKVISLFMAFLVGMRVAMTEYNKASYRWPVLVVTNMRNFIGWYGPGSLEIQEISDVLSSKEVVELLTNKKLDLNASRYIVPVLSKKAASELVSYLDNKN